MRQPLSRAPVIDTVKAVASQLIVWHHLAAYGPMSDVVFPHATQGLDWLYEQARLAVQAFLVMGGFLTSRSLMPQGRAVPLASLRHDVAPLVWRRYTRLVLPYAVALGLAVASAWFARGLIDHPTIPEPPSFVQVLAHLLLLQDIAGIDALSAGVWYVAIDFQLYTLVVLLLWSSRAASNLTDRRSAVLLLWLCLGLTLASLVWINRQAALDMWAPYFFGAYGLGMLAERISMRRDKGVRVLLLTLVIGLALWVEWRSRILVAGGVALALAWFGGTSSMARGLFAASMEFLGRISYSVFLVHYPVCLAVNALVYRVWPDDVAANVAGMVAAWLLSVAAGAWLHRNVESAWRPASHPDMHPAPYPAATTARRTSSAAPVQSSAASSPRGH